MFWAVCSFTLGALLGDSGGILLVSCLYIFLKRQPLEETVYYLSPRWTPPSAAPHRVSLTEQVS
jgi:hypothetical protein